MSSSSSVMRMHGQTSCSPKAVQRCSGCRPYVPSYVMPLHAFTWTCFTYLLVWSFYTILLQHFVLLFRLVRKRFISLCIFFFFAFKFFSMHFLPQSIKQSFNMASTGILSKSGYYKWLITYSRMGFNNSCTWFFSHLFLYMLLWWSLKLFPWHCLWPSFILNIAENFLRFFSITLFSEVSPCNCYAFVSKLFVLIHDIKPSLLFFCILITCRAPKRN